jgi:hypothetical protein
VRNAKFGAESEARQVAEGVIAQKETDASRQGEEIADLDGQLVKVMTERGRWTSKNPIVRLFRHKTPMFNVFFSDSRVVCCRYVRP